LGSTTPACSERRVASPAAAAQWQTMAPVAINSSNKAATAWPLMA
jgi:hypothetical protein